MVAVDNILGIDLGTTNSLIAILRSDKAGNDKVEIIPDADGAKELQSLLCLDTNSKPCIGRLNDESAPHVRSIKRLMGKTKGEALTSVGHLYHISENHDDLRVSIGDLDLTPIEVSAEILKRLKRRAEDYLKTAVKRAVITVPAYFGESERTATKEAAELAGIDVVRLLSEPTAAAVSYGVYSRNIEEEEGKVYLVYDLGGGTFDVSVLKMVEGVIRVLAVAGDNMLGGDDFDLALLNHICTRYKKGDQHKTGLPQMMQQTKNIKEILTQDAQWSGEFIFLRGDTEGAEDIENVTITREEFEEVISDYVDRTISMVKQCLQDAEIPVESIEELILVGGSSRIPLIHKKMEELIGKRSVTGINPDEIVATGAAIQAASLQGKGSDHLLMDVTPLSLGLELMGEAVEVLIPRNAPIPTAASQTFTNHKKGQTQMAIRVFQGEGETVSQCRSIGSFILKGIPPMDAGKARIEVRFMMDADGILVVSAMEKTSGVKQEVEIRPLYGLTHNKAKDLMGL